MTEEKKKIIGDILQQKRQELNLEIKDIALYLKIKTYDIEALESEDWERITRHLYRPGLIRSYAKMLKIDDIIIEEKIKELPFESNVKNKKHKLINIGEEIDLTPSRDMFFNFLLISFLMFLILLSIYNGAEDKSRVLGTDALIEQMGKIAE